LTSILHFFQGIPNWLTTITISAIPVIELRGAIPLAVTVFKMDPKLAMALGVLGSLLPVLPIFIILSLITKYIYHFPQIAKFLNWVFDRTRRKGKNIEKYKLLGLILFVGIPLPGTGVWTGSIAAYLFGLSMWSTFVGCFLGTLIAGIIMTAGSLGIKSLVS